MLTDDLPILLSLCSRSYCCNGGMALSNPGLEEAVTDRISFIRFSGSSLSSTLPDHSTLCRFRNSLLAQNLFERLFEEINRQREERGILVRESNGAILDATIVESSRRPRTVTEELSLPVISYSDDPDAT
ncbi:MAG: transposase [Syntrophorhabdus sp.]